MRYPDVAQLLMIGLAMMWAVVLLPEAFDLLRRRSLTGADSISSFNQRLAVLERTSGPGSVTLGEISNVVPLRGQSDADRLGTVVPAEPHDRHARSAREAARPSVGRPRSAPSASMRRRRAQVLGILGASVVASAMLAFKLGFFGVLVFALTSGLAVTYVVALVGVARRERMLANVAPIRVPSKAPVSARPMVQPERRVAN